MKTGLWYRALVQGYETRLLYRAMVETIMVQGYGTGLWYKAMVVWYGTGLWYKVMVQDYSKSSAGKKDVFVDLPKISANAPLSSGWDHSRSSLMAGQSHYTIRLFTRSPGKQPLKLAIAIHLAISGNSSSSIDYGTICHVSGYRRTKAVLRTYVIHTLNVIAKSRS